MTPTDVHPYLHLVPWICDLVAYVVPTAFLAIFVVCAARAIREGSRARARAARAKGADLVPGREAVVHGTVVSDDEAPPWTVDVHQRFGVDPEDSEDAWLETERRQTALPFHLEIAPGRRVRVEPDADARLVGPALETVDTTEATRVRRATLASGTMAIVEGTVATGLDAAASYRGGPGPVLGGPRLLVSTLAPGEPERTRAVGYGVAAAAVLLLGGSCALFVGPLVLGWRGVVVSADVTRRWIDVEQDGDDGPNVRHLVRMRIHRGEPNAGVTFEAEVWESDAGRLSPGTRVAARTIPGGRTAALGRTPTFTPGRAALPIVALLLALAMLVVARRQRTGWWEPPLVERASPPRPRAR